METIAKGLRFLADRQLDGYVAKENLLYSDNQLDGKSNDADAKSISSCSNCSTVEDDIRHSIQMDPFMCHSTAGKIERILFWLRIRLTTPDPITIMKHIEFFTYHYSPTYGQRLPLNDVLNNFTYVPSGATIIFGLKSLILQTQSMSLFRSTKALASLIHLSMRVSPADSGALADFYLAVSDVEPIFNMESLDISLDDNLRLEKQFSLFLVKLAKANVIALQFSDPSMELAHGLRQKLLRLFESRRLVTFDLLESITDACFIYAHAVSYVSSPFKSAIAHIMETIHFLVVFLLQSITDLYVQASSFEKRTREHAYLVLSTFTHWFDVNLQKWGGSTLPLYNFNPALLEYGFAFYGLLYAISTRYAVAKAFLPLSIGRYSYLIENSVLPRRIRATITEKSLHPPAVQSSIQISAQRTARLLASFSELEWEAWDATLRHNHAVLQMEQDEYCSEDRGDWGEDVLKRQFYRAQQVHVSEDDLTKEFRIAQSDVFEEGDQKPLFWCILFWKNYKTKCKWRREWEPFFRSNLDWDWDLAGSLTQLYNLGNPSPFNDRPPFQVDAS